MPGHPNKVADHVVEALVDAFLNEDASSRLSCEAVTKMGFVMVVGDVVTKAKKVDVDHVVRTVIKDLGYDAEDKGLDYRTMEVVNKVKLTAPDATDDDFCESSPASDQGCFSAYATSETPEQLPQAEVLATAVASKIDELRRTGGLLWLRPDGQVQVVLECRHEAEGAIAAVRVHAVVVSVQHEPTVELEKVREEITERVVKTVIPPALLDSSTLIQVNQACRFVVGGPRTDTGMSGQQGRGAEAFCGRDPSKVGRAAPYQLRRAAKSLVSSNLVARCTIEAAYAPGTAQPICISVNSFGTARKGLSDAKLSELVRKKFDFRPGAIVKELKLRCVLFRPMITAGHFGRSDSSLEWEKPETLSL